MSRGLALCNDTSRVIPNADHTRDVRFNASSITMENNDCPRSKNRKDIRLRVYEVPSIFMGTSRVICIDLFDHEKE